MKLNKNNRRIFLPSLIMGISSGVVIAGAGGFLTYYFINKDNKTGTPKRKNNIGDGKDIAFTELPNVNVHYFPEGGTVENPENDISVEGVQRILTRFRNEVPFGPEIGALKSIIFNDINLIDPEEQNGIYYPSTNQIGISVSTILKRAKDYKINLTEAEKEDSVFQVLAHEYGHHIFYFYAASAFPTNDSSNWETISNHGTNKQHISKTYYDWFYNAFNYGDTSKKAEIQGGIEYPVGSGETLDNIAETWSLKDLYDNANKDGDLKTDPDKDYTFYYGEEPVGLQKRFPANIVNQRELGYLYSIPELLTRKYELATIGFSDAAKTTLKPRAQGNVLTTMMSDYLKYNKALFPAINQSDADWINNFREQSGPNSFAVEQIMKDDPFNEGQDASKTVAQEFVENTTTRMGRTDFSNLSLLMSKNSFEVLTQKWLNKKPGWSSTEGNQLKVGGYLTDTQNQKMQNSQVKYLAYKNGTNFIKLSNFKIYNKDIKVKSNALDSNPTIDINGSDWMWVTDGYFDANAAQNKQLYYVYGDGTTNIQMPLETVKNSNTAGVASTWLENYRNTKSHLWKGKEDSNVVSIYRGRENGQYSYSN